MCSRRLRSSSRPSRAVVPSISSWEKVWAWGKTQIPSLYVRLGPTFFLLAPLALSLALHLGSRPIALYLLFELCWYAYFQLALKPSLVHFRPEDAGAPLEAACVDRIVSDVCTVIRRDPKAFWSRVVGSPVRSLVRYESARSFLMSLLFYEEGSAAHSHPSQVSLFEGALSSLEVASGGFSSPPSGPPPPLSVTAASPNLIRAWLDDGKLGKLVRSTPLFMIGVSLAASTLTYCAMRLGGWTRVAVGKDSRLETWVFKPKRKGGAQGERPVLLIPGAGFGLTSFLPVALLLQCKLAKNRELVLYRLPWVEVCRPWTPLPQWSSIMSDLLTGLSSAQLSSQTVDVVAHSYGTAVANRLLRELLSGSGGCRPQAPSGRRSDAASAALSSPPLPTTTTTLTLHSLALLDPICLGGATTGIAGCTINAAGPDLSFAFCGNRAGVSSKECMDYDVTGGGGGGKGRTRGGGRQCEGGIRVYMSAEDPLADVGLARDVLARAAGSNGIVFGDETVHAFHGRWLVELWFGGYFWSAPCCSNCINVLDVTLRPSSDEKQRGTKKGKKGKVESQNEDRMKLLGVNAGCDTNSYCYETRVV